ncbi:MAG: hypothetical protein AAF847_14980 [Bacteroidota bacterium]
MKLNYQQLSVITYTIMLILVIVAGLNSSADLVVTIMILAPVIFILFALLILRYKEESQSTLEEHNDWYEH